MSREGFATDPTKGYAPLWYSGSGNLTTEKAPTTVLVKPDGKTLEAFGYDAENKYRELMEDEEADGFYYFRRFKMMRMKNFGEKITLEAELEDDMGRRLPAITVFTLAIEFLVQNAYSTLVKSIFGLSFGDIKWVLTVPAIWTDPAKKFMRQAAEKAGIAPGDLVIALEPECASIYCQHLPLVKRLDDTKVDVSSFPAGTKYMVIDAGGGTIDITVHETEQSKTLKEIIAASGGGWGGILVDQAFEEILIDLFGNNVYQKFKNTETDTWLDLGRDFEVKKRSFNGRPGTITIPISLMELDKDEHRVDLAERIKSSKYSNSLTLLRHNKLKFESSIWENLHDHAITKTIDHVKEVFKNEEVKDVKTILLVGGFADSILLQRRMKDAFQLDVVIPMDASSAILRGALIFGFNPGCISKRVMQYTYGFGCTLPFIEGTHPESERVVLDSGILCRNCFDKHVEIGQVVKYGEPETPQCYKPINKNQEKISIPLYYSKLKDPKYIDEEGCVLLGSFAVPLTDSTGDLNRRVCVSLTFSGTEIEAEGREESTGIVTKANFRLPD